MEVDIRSWEQRGQEQWDTEGEMTVQGLWLIYLHNEEPELNPAMDPLKNHEMIWEMFVQEQRAGTYDHRLLCPMSILWG